MTIDEQLFLDDYISAIHDGQAALFVGAGLSISSQGYVDWRELLGECARALRMDITQEEDLVAVAQYYVNRQPDGRAKLNQIIQNRFEHEGEITDNHRLIAALPIGTIWTTNFDCLLEKALKEAKRTVDVKRRDQDIPRATKGRDVILYKMHGDVTDPGNTVLCKEDYECYGSTHHVFQNSLEADLISKTFLFLGFSFADPNLRYMLGHLRSILKDSRRAHYAVMRRVRRNFHSRLPDDEQERLFTYAENKQSLMIEDLRRYNIQTIEIDEYPEVTEILMALSNGCNRRSVFVSGSTDRAATFSEDRLRDLCIGLGQRLIRKEFKLVSGMGLNIGSDVVNGALVQLYNAGRSSLEQRITLRPFPRNLPPDLDQEQFYGKYRRDSIQLCGSVIFVAGRSRHHDISDGVMKEYKIAVALGKTCIPIGATGCAAGQIWEELRPRIQSHYHGKVSEELFARLNDPSLTNEAILGAVFEILDRLSGFDHLVPARRAATGNGHQRAAGPPRSRRVKQFDRPPA